MHLLNRRSVIADEQFLNLLQIGVDLIPVFLEHLSNHYSTSKVFIRLEFMISSTTSTLNLEVLSVWEWTLASFITIFNGIELHIIALTCVSCALTRCMSNSMLNCRYMSSPDTPY